MSKHDLLIRVSKFSAEVLKMMDKVPRKGQTDALLNQMNRACISVSLNYSEAMAAESRKDFIHKMSISLKELRETYTYLLLMRNMMDRADKFDLTALLDEYDQLISIFVQSIITAKTNQQRKPH